MTISWMHGAAAILMAAATGLTATACGSSSTSTSRAATAEGPACDTSGAVATAKTATYQMVGSIGAVEDMYSEQEVQSKHPTSGEVMLGGVMSDASGPNARHLEVHICTLSDGKVVRGANPTIALTDTTTGQAAQTVPISMMKGVTSGDNDLHYGNNVVIKPGDAYKVAVTLNGEMATMTLTPS